MIQLRAPGGAETCPWTSSTLVPLNTFVLPLLGPGVDEGQDRLSLNRVVGLLAQVKRSGPSRAYPTLAHLSTSTFQPLVLARSRLFPSGSFTPYSTCRSGGRTSIGSV